MSNNDVASHRIPGYVSEIMRIIDKAGYKAYVVGGAARDIVLGRIPHDYDVATSAKPDEVVAVFERSGIHYYDNAAKHGTVTAVTGSGDVEVTTFREDGEYSDQRRPDQVVFKTTIDDDVKRRDFTINAMYMNADGDICDPEGGVTDCRRKLIRAVGDPDVRFGEDALRILRGIRFCSSLGFEIEADTLSAMEKHAEDLGKISEERIASELTRIVSGRYAPKAVRTGWKILSVIIPEIAQCRGFDQRSNFHDRDVLEHILDVLEQIPFSEENGRDPELAMAALFHDIGKPVCFKVDEFGTGHMKGHPVISAGISERVLTDLKFPKQFVSNVSLLVMLHDTYIKPDRIEIHKFMSKYPIEIIDKLRILQRADILAHSALGQKRMSRLEAMNEVIDELKSSDAVFSVKDLDIDGNDIIALGVKPGPQIGELLEKVFECYLNERCSNSKIGLINQAKKLLSD